MFDGGIPTMKDKKDIKKIAGKYGFSNKHMNDMATRYKDDEYENIEVPEDDPGVNPDDGLRQSIIRP